MNKKNVKTQRNHFNRVSLHSIASSPLSAWKFVHCICRRLFDFSVFCSLCKLCFDLIVERLPLGYFSFQLFPIHAWIYKELFLLFVLLLLCNYRLAKKHLTFNLTSFVFNEWSLCHKNKFKNVILEYHFQNKLTPIWRVQTRVKK